MKKLFTLIFAVLTASLIAQQWCPPGARWQYRSTSGLLGVDATLEYSYTGDTLVNGVSCKRISALFMGMHGYRYPLVTYTVVPDFDVFHTYENNRVVYVQNGASFDTIVNYNALPGDRWTIRGLNQWCPLSNQWIVQDTASLIHNGKRLKMITAKCFPDSKYWSGGPMTNIFVERVNHFLSISDFDFMRGRCYHGAAEFANTSFICYYDDEIGVFSTSGHDCQKITGTHDYLREAIQIFSDQATGELLVTVPFFGYSTKVFDLLGRQVAAGILHCGENRLKINSDSGVYVVSVYKDGAQAKTAKVILGQ